MADPVGDNQCGCTFAAVHCCSYIIYYLSVSPLMRCESSDKRLIVSAIIKVKISFVNENLGFDNGTTCRELVLIDLMNRISQM